MILLTAAAFALLLLTAFILARMNKREQMFLDCFIIISAGLIVHLFATSITEGFPSDIQCFKSWSETLRTSGFSSLYNLNLTDYPPGYLYILSALAHIRNFLGIGIDTAANVFLLKLPSIMCDIMTAVFVYFIAEKWRGKKTAMIIGIIVVLNPATIFISSVWGQVDSVLALLLVASIYFITERKMLTGVLIFMLAIITKPQALILSPVLIFDFYRYLRENKFAPKSFARLGIYGLCCIVLGFLLILPFTIKDGSINFMPVFEQYVNTLASYPHVTVNAYNIYALLGLNWVSSGNTFLFMTYDTLGIIFIVLITAAAFFSLFKDDSKENYFLTGAFLYFSVFMLAVKMHERYSFPAMIFLIFAFVFRNNRKTIISYAALSAVFLLNCADVLCLYLPDINHRIWDITLPLFSYFYIAVFVYFLHTYFSRLFAKNKNSVPEDGKDDADNMENAVENKTNNYFDLSDLAANVKKKFAEWRVKEPKPLSLGNEKRVTKKDLMILAAIMFVYSVISFYNLGNMKSPVNEYLFGNEPVIVDFGAEYEVSRMQFLLGARNEKTLYLSFSSDGENYGDEIDIGAVSVFAWGEIRLETADYNDENPTEDESTIKTSGVFARYAMLRSIYSDTYYQELAFRDMNGGLVPIVSVSQSAEALFDEQALVPESNNVMNSTYFDEIYHARSAYEYLNSLHMYEWTHPPLGKLFMAAGIKIFGMTPFGWRFSGNVFGILMIPIIYLFAKRIFKKTYWAMFAALIFTFDFMHFAQTRIATIDTYITFFVILMYYFMYLFYEGSIHDSGFRKKYLPLLLSGICMGLGIACKWPGMYAGLGLAVLFLLAMLKRHKEYREAKKNENTEITERYSGDVVRVILWCVLSFGLIPLAIYVCSYIPYYLNCALHYANSAEANKLIEALPEALRNNGLVKFICSVIPEQSRMYTYHSVTVRDSTHPYSSRWYEWPTMIVPMWYYAKEAANGLKAGISSFGNPAVWWVGIPAFFYSIWAYIKRKDRVILFLALAYLAQFLPWTLVSRTTYIYHYFPSVPFVVFMITYMFGSFGFKRARTAGIIYLCVTVLLFILFYPVLSGLPVNVSFVVSALRWLPRWVLI